MINNPTLQKIEKTIMAKVPAQLRAAVQNAVMAGLKIMHSPQTHAMMIQQLTKPGDPATNAGEGAAKLVGILFKTANGKLPIKALIPAGQILLCEGLSFMAQAGQIQINNNVISRATQSYASNVLQLFGITPEKVQQAVIQAHANAQAQKMQQSAPLQAPQQTQQQAAPGGIVGGAMAGA